MLTARLLLTRFPLFLFFVLLCILSFLCFFNILIKGSFITAIYCLYIVVQLDCTSNQVASELPAGFPKFLHFARRTPCFSVPPASACLFTPCRFLQCSYQVRFAFCTPNAVLPQLLPQVFHCDLYLGMLYFFSSQAALDFRHTFRFASLRALRLLYQEAHVASLYPAWPYLSVSSVNGQLIVKGKNVVQRSLKKKISQHFSQNRGALAVKTSYCWPMVK